MCIMTFKHWRKPPTLKQVNENWKKFKLVINQRKQTNKQIPTSENTVSVKE